MRMPGRTLLVLLLWWLGMASAHADVPPPWRVGVLYWSETIPSQQTMRRGLERQAQRINDKALAAGERGLQLLPEVAGDGPEGKPNAGWPYSIQGFLHHIALFKALEENPDQKAERKCGC